MAAWDDEFLCNECETPHDSIEGADECCSCPRCTELEAALNRLDQQVSRLMDGNPDMVDYSVIEESEKRLWEKL